MCLSKFYKIIILNNIKTCQGVFGMNKIAIATISAINSIIQEEKTCPIKKGKLFENSNKEKKNEKKKKL